MSEDYSIERCKIENTIFASGLKEDINREYLQMLNSILKLQDIQLAAHENNTSFASSYVYIKKFNMTSIYPNILVDSIIAEFDNFENIRPQSYDMYINNNMSIKDYYWTEPYLDRTGKGMMVTCSMPLYKENDFIGVISVDVVLDFLSKLTEKTKILPGEFFLVSKDGNIIISSEFSYKETDSIIKFKDYYSEISESNNYIKYTRTLKNARWNYVYIISEDELRTSILIEMKFYIISVTTILIFSGLMYLFIKKYFVNPSIQSEIDFKKMNKELINTKKNLELNLLKLKNTQNEIVESEKLNALSTLVIGVAHEINTPLGSSITNNSFVEQRIKIIDKKIIDNQLTKNDLIEFIENVKKSTNMIHDNLDEVVKLVETFKLISAKQTYYSLKKFDLEKTIKNTILVYKPLYNNTSLNIKVYCNNIILESYERVFEQIISNLINNSIIHGFDDINSGIITITVRGHSDKYEIIYADNGKGIDKEGKDKIFEPFYTTKRAKGTGLGMFIIYNMIKEKLNGNIVVKDSEEGFVLSVTWPK